jgi:hypothetical protein
VEIRADFVGIVTRNMGASLAFYRRLGLEVPPGSEDEPHAEAATPTATTWTRSRRFSC